MATFARPIKGTRPTDRGPASKSPLRPIGIAPIRIGLTPAREPRIAKPEVEPSEAREDGSLPDGVAKLGQATGIRPKLRVGHIDDPLERQADAVADRVMRMPAPAVADVDTTADVEDESDQESLESTNVVGLAGAADPPDSRGLVLQRKCASCEEEDQLRRAPMRDVLRREPDPFVDRVTRMSTANELVVQRKCSSCEEEDQLRRSPMLDLRGSASVAPSWNRLDHSAIQRKCSACEQEDAELRRSPAHEAQREAAGGLAGGFASNEFAQRLSIARSGTGQSLSASARSFLEPRLGTDLGHLRVHTDRSADDLAAAISARAFTQGHHLFFAAGEYNPASREGMQLIAHEVAHTLQARGPAVELRRETHTISKVEPQSPEPAAPQTTSEAPLDYGADFLAQSEQLYKKVELLRFHLVALTNDLLEPTESEDEDGNPTGEMANELERLGVPPALRSKAEAAGERFLKITTYFESRDTLESVLMSQWLDAAITAIGLFRDCIRDYAKREPEFAETVAKPYLSRLRVLSARAKKLRKLAFFEEGAQIEEVIRPIEEAEFKAAFEAKRAAAIERELDLARAEMRAYWHTKPDEQIRAERERLRGKLTEQQNKRFTGGLAVQANIKLLEAQIQVLDELIAETNFVAGPTVFERAESLVSAAEDSLPRAAQGMAGLLNASDPEAGVILVEVFSKIAYQEESDATRTGRLAELVLGGLKNPAETLAALESGGHWDKILLDWLSPSSRPDVEFGMQVLWAVPDKTGASKRSPAEVVQILLDMPKAARARAVITATRLLGKSGQASRYVRFAETRHLLVEMVYQLWADGFSYDKVEIGDALARTIAPTRGAGHGNTLSIRAGDFDVQRDSGSDSFTLTVESKGFESHYSVEPTDVLVLELDSSYSGVRIPALKLLELDAKQDRGLMVEWGQDLAHSATEGGEIINNFLEREAKERLEWAQQKLDDSVAGARELVRDYVPEEYQSYAQGAVSILESAGNGVLTGAAAVEGLRVGVQKGAVNLVSGTAALAGGAMAGTGEIVNDIREGDLIEDMSVGYDQATSTINTAIDVAPEIADAFLEQAKKKWNAADMKGKVFMASDVAGQVLFEVGLEVAVGGMGTANHARKAADLADDLADASKLGRAAEDLDDLPGATSRTDAHFDAVDNQSRKPADADLQQKIDDVAPGTEVWVDERLDPGDVIVEYDMVNGVIDPASLRIVTGVDASPRWVKLHVATVTRLKQYSGLQGRIRNLLAKIRRALTGVDETIGSPLWEARREVEKLEYMIGSRLNDLARVSPDSAAAAKIEDELRDLSAQFERWSDVADREVEALAARGHIAAEGGKPGSDGYQDDLSPADTNGPEADNPIDTQIRDTTGATFPSRGHEGGASSDSGPVPAELLAGTQDEIRARQGRWVPTDPEQIKLYDEIAAALASDEDYTDGVVHLSEYMAGVQDPGEIKQILENLATVARSEDVDILYMSIPSRGTMSGPVVGRVRISSTDKLFSVEDASNPDFNAWFELNEEGHMMGGVKTKIAGKRGALGGYEVFKAGLHHFGPAVKGVRAEWNIKYFEQLDNLNAFNKYLADAGVKPGDVPSVELLKQAALHTHTGRWAAREGFTEVTVGKPAPGKYPYTVVRPLFTRP